jgi:predicted alpha/beta-fold hydrolase
LNWRGAGPSTGKTQAFYHAGRSDDLTAVIGSMSGALAANGVAAVGYSMGANVLLKYLAERGGLSHLRAAVAVSPPIDLRAAQQRIAVRRNRRYHHYLLERMRSERPCPDDVKSILDFDNRVVAPSNGFRDAGSWRSAQRSRSARSARHPRHPRRDDPWIPSRVFRESVGTAEERALLMP